MRKLSVILRWTNLLSPIVLVACLPTVAQAQCSRCSLQLNPVVELNSSDAPLVPSLVVSVAMLRSAEYVVSYRFVKPAIALFSSQGTLLRTYDKSGGGPGELQSDPLLAAGYGDTLYALDRTRVMRFDNSLRYLDTRIIDVPARERAIVLADGRIALDALRRHADGRVSTTSIVSIATPSQTKDLGADMDPNSAVGTLIAEAGRGGLWTMRANNSQLRHHTPGATPDMTVHDIRRPWFEAWTQRNEGEGWTVPPRPANAWLTEAANGCLLVGTRVADKHWKSPLDARGRVNPSAVDLSALYDTVVELIDPGSGTVLTKITSPRELVPVSGTRDRFVSTRLDSDGHVIIEVTKIDILLGADTAERPCRANNSNK